MDSLPRPQAKEEAKAAMPALVGSWLGVPTRHSADDGD